MDFEVCQAFHMSWREWKEQTPAYVQRVWADLLNIKRRAESAAIERERARHQRAGEMQ